MGYIPNLGNLTIMSRLSTLSPAAIKAMFSPESEDILITLITIKQNTAIGIPSDIYLADNYTQRLSEDDQDIYYGVISNGISYPFIPLEITLPNDDNNAAPTCTINIHDVTRRLIPSLRSITGAPSILITLVLSSSPDTIETQFVGFKLTNISYDANTISASLTMPSLDVEPFPAHSFTPSYFPGLF